MISIGLGVTTKLRPPVGNTIGGSLILPRSPSSTGGRSSSRAENTREDVTCVRDEWLLAGRIDGAGTARGATT